jgi:tetratricopeptide (TPR) repeat protein
MSSRRERTTTSSPAAIASRMNNGGVALMKRANYSEAIASYTAALAKVKQMLIEDENDEDSSDVADEQSGGSSDSIAFAQDDFPTGAESDSKELMMSDPNSRSIFCRPILLRNRNEKACVELYNKFSFAIMFNLALAHHLSGMKCTESKRGKLRKALRLYEFAYSIQMQEDVQLQITYTLGMVNNLGHIQELLGEEQKAQQCFQHLLSTLMYVMESGEESNEGQWDVFLHNVTHLVLRETSMAAAA